MKLCLVALCATAALAHAPPRIELDLSGFQTLTQGVATVEQHAPVHYEHEVEGVTSVQDWTERCPAAASTNADNCPEPEAKAYDHHNGELDVTRRVYLVDYDNAQTKDGVALPTECTDSSSVCTGIDYTKRSIYLIKFDAQDASGNHAEQIVFGLILDDTAAPVISWDAYQCHETAGNCKPATCTGTHAACQANVNDQEACEHIMRTRSAWGCSWESAEGRRCFNNFRSQGFVEAATSWRFCPASALDIYDGTRTVKYAIQNTNTGAWIIAKDSAVPYASAKDMLDTLTLGSFTITAITSDDAGGLGSGGEDNVAEQDVTITVDDERKPWITVSGFGIVDERTQWDTDTYPCDPQVHPWGCAVQGRPLECGIVYTADCTADQLANQASMGIACDEGANIYDKLDDAVSTRTPTLASTLADYPIDSTMTTDQYVNYTGTDVKGNSATLRSRIVSVRDTTAPTITLEPCAEGICTHEAGTGAWTDPGVSCVDACDPSPTMVDPSDPDLAGYPMWSPAFDDVAVGTYTRIYKCKDASGLVTTVNRTVEVEDNGAPVITINPCTTAPTELGAPHCLVEAALDGVFTDPSATCTDLRDGSIDVTLPEGQTPVDLSTIGTYTITYRCEDAATNSIEQTRTVQVVDTTAPTMVLQGQQTEYVEAGFPYEDPMLSCSVGDGCAVDNISGDISDRIVATDGTVTVIDAFAQFRTCAEIKTAFAAEAPGAVKPDGWYTVSLKVGETIGLHKVWCDLAAGVTYFPSDRIQEGTADAVVPYAGVDGSCVSKGMVMAQFGTGATELARKAKVQKEFGDQFFLEGDSAASTNYICSFNELTSTSLPSHTVGNGDNTVGDIRHAVPGTYEIRYDVSDDANPPNAATSLYRTVHVRDTLPPVIVMSLPGNNQHISDSSATGLNGVANPAGDAAHNPFIKPFGAMGAMDSVSLMAEGAQASVNGWFIAAVASAVAGVALLTMRRQTAVATSVPV